MPEVIHFLSVNIMCRTHLMDPRISHGSLAACLVFAEGIEKLVPCLDKCLN
ncbi:unnamed protein product, partial [Larinioides sclopetarius]